MKINLTQVSKAYIGASVISVTTGAVGGYVLAKLGYEPDFGLLMAGTWLTTCGVPSLVVSGNTLRKLLGEKSSPRVTAGTLSRKIPINGGLSHVFMSVLPGARNVPKEDYGLTENFTVSVDGNSHTITTFDLEDFLRTVWRRQLSGLNGLSRPYWTKQHRPRLKTLEYQTRMSVLSSVNGLIVDRSKRRSGRLSLSPLAALGVLEANL